MKKSSRIKIYIAEDESIILMNFKMILQQLGYEVVGSSVNGEKALKDIEKQGLRLVPLCPFVAGYIHKHPEWKRIVMKGIHIQ